MAERITYAMDEAGDDTSKRRWIGVCAQCGANMWTWDNLTQYGHDEDCALRTTAPEPIYRPRPA